MLIATPERLKAARGLGLAVAFQLCAAFLCVGPAAAWGSVAHRAIASLAEGQLTPEAGKEVRRLLMLEGAPGLADVVMWADQIRRQQVPGSPEHDVPIPFDAAGYDAARDCQNFCIVRAIPFYLAILADRAKPDAERLDALKYVIHLVGDIHQPLHTSQNGGGQLVAWDTKVVYLHILWDVTIVSATYPTSAVLAEALSKRVGSLASCGLPEQWANEGHEIEKSFVYPALGPERRQPIILPTDYAPQALPIIEERLALATARLSCVLNGALDPLK